MKTCSRCKIEKEFSEFYKHKLSKDGFLGGCKPCRKSYYQKYNNVNKDRISKQSKTYREANKESVSLYHKSYYKSNKEYLIKQSKCYYKNNKDKCIKQIGKYNKNRKLIDPLFKMKCNLRTRTWISFRNKGYKKSSKTQEMLGVDWEVCKAHIEKQFTEGMNWDNYGKWHIDHIIPLALAKNKEELMKLCHYKNLQPLWAEDNIKKSNKIQGQQTYFKL